MLPIISRRVSLKNIFFSFISSKSVKREKRLCELFKPEFRYNDIALELRNRYFLSEYKFKMNH